MFQIQPNKRPSAPASGMFTDGERKRLFLYLFGLLGICGGFAATYMNLGKGSERAQAEAEVEQLRSQIALPALRIEEYRAEAKDSTQAERSLIETQALDIALADARLYSPQHFEPMNGVELDRALCAEFAERSSELRGKVVRLRGLLDELIEYESAPGVVGHYRGRATLEDGAPAFVSFVSSGEIELGAGDFIMLEGFFLKNQAQNTPESGWVEGPLIVGPRAQRSYPSLGRVTSLSPDDFLDVEDDSLTEGMRPTPAVYWKLLAYARDLEPNSIDWSKAPLLDAATMQQLAADPARFRGMPMRIPGCVVQDIWRQAKRENPARLTHLTEGWLGSFEWLSTLHRVVRFDSPMPNPGIVKSGQMTAQGFFLRVHAYESAGRGTQLAPLFVLHSMAPFAPQKDRTLGLVLAVLGTTFVAVLVLFLVLMRRDEKKAAVLTRQLVERRRQRRAKAKQGAGAQ
mgnify:CR=1 FL=1